VKMVQSKMVEN